jgi:uncharacterized protein
VIAYVDASVVVRVLLAEPDPLREWRSLDRLVSSRLLEVECLRALDRLRLLEHVDDRTSGERRRALLDTLATVDVVPLDERILERAAQPFPTLVRTLDAIHLASALEVRDEIDDLLFATHDERLGLAASAMGFAVVGLP